MKKVFLILFFLFFGVSVFAQREIPKYYNYVNDYADILNQEEENILNKELKDLDDKSSSEMTILTINSLNGDSLEDYSIDVARNWGIGKKDLNNGILLLIVKNDRKIRIEVGYGLEGTITDAQGFWLMENILKPGFRKGDFFHPILEFTKKVKLAILNDVSLPVKKRNFWSSDYLFLGGVLAWIFGVVLLFWFYYRWYKIKNTFPKIIRKPYWNYHPFLTGFLIDKKIDSSDLIAGIIYLAQKRYIEIKKEKKDGLILDKDKYYFYLRVPKYVVEDELDRLLIKLIFLSDFGDKIKRHGFYLKKDLETLINNPNEVGRRRRTLKKWLIEYSKKNNILEKKDLLSFDWGGKIKYIDFILTIIFITLILVSKGVILYLLIILFLPFAFLGYRYSKRGWEIKYRLESFKRFLKDGELLPEEKTQEKFFEFLPYAYAFEVEKDWIKKFDNIEIPEWYRSFEKINSSDLFKDLGDIKKIIAGIGAGVIISGGNVYYSRSSGSGSFWSVSGGGSSFGGFGGGGFGGGGVSGGW